MTDGFAPLRSRCRLCRHVWTVAYYPMGVTTLAGADAVAVCPRCGDEHPVVAGRHDGELLEEPSAVSDPVVIRLEGTPRGKGRPRMGRNRVVYTDDATRAYEDALRWQAQGAMRGRDLLTGPVKLRVYAEFPIPASWPQWKRTAAARALFHGSVPDLDNIVKCKDALNGIVWADDSQVAMLTAWKKYGPDPHVTFIVSQLSEPSDAAEAEAA